MLERIGESMNLNTYFQISVSVFCTISTITLVAFLIWAIILRTQINKLIKKLLEISEIAKETAGDSRAFVTRTIESLEKFKNSIFTFEFARRVVTEIISLVQENKSRSASKQKKRSTR